MLRKAGFFVTGVLALALGAGAAHAMWIQDGVAVSTSFYDAPQQQMIADGAGGTIIVWRERRGGSYDIYAQRIDAYGRVLWTAGGVAVCTWSNDQGNPNLVSDGAGGALITWEDGRTGTNHSYAQRLNANGVAQWTAGGILLTSSVPAQSFPVIAPDGLGGAIIAWQDMRNGSNWDVYAQRVASNGALQWTGGGLAVCAATGNQTNVMIVPDLVQLPGWGGGAIVTWTDTRNGNDDIFAQLIDATGSVAWGSSGAAVCNAANAQNYPRLTPDGNGGAIIAWQDYRSGSHYDVYAQRMKPNGAAMWTSNGVGVCTAAGSQVDPRLVSDGAGGAIISFYGYPVGSNTDVYAQRIDAYGNSLWAAGGITVCNAAGDQGFAVLVSDGDGGAIIAWHDYRTGYADIYAQRVRSTGTSAWAGNGAEVSGALYEQQYPVIASDDAGGAIAAWRDMRSDPYFGLYIDVYAQRVDRSGFWGYPAPSIKSVRDVRGDQGGLLNVSWNASRLDPWPTQGISEYTVWRALTPEALAALRASRSVRVVESPHAVLPNDKPVVRVERGSGRTFYWELVATVDASHLSSYAKVVPTLFDSTSTSSGYHYFQVVAHGGSSDFWVSLSDSGSSVDNLSPALPAGLAGEQEYSPAGLRLTWESNDEADLAEYAIYRGTSPDFVPGPGNLVASTPDTLYLDGAWRWDGGYYYKVAAIDIHGNESARALLGPDAVTGDETPRTPLATYLAQNFPNPFNPTTKIVFGLSAPAHVSLRIYDASGRLVRELVNEARPAARYEEVWDGRDGAVRQVASGIYFYRLDAGSFTQTRKMILLR